VVTAPVFSADHQLILAEGTRLSGEVTRAVPARHFHRNGQLRFLVDSVAPADTQPTPLLASLYSVQSDAGDQVAIDDEGGASVTNSKTRFIMAALAVLALRASGDHDRHIDEDAPGGPRMVQGGGGGNPLGGFLGFGIAGIAMSQISRPVGLTLSAIGAARTVYRNILGKGAEVSFPVDTPIELQLAPGPTPAAASTPSAP
jgi:hypothetical protein